jgi:hypothetical protein
VLLALLKITFFFSTLEITATSNHNKVKKSVNLRREGINSWIPGRHDCWRNYTFTIDDSSASD